MVSIAFKKAKQRFIAANPRLLDLWWGEKKRCLRSFFCEAVRSLLEVFFFSMLRRICSSDLVSPVLQRIFRENNYRLLYL